jgi:hypothetical protein
VSPADAERAVALMEEMSIGLRGCAILGASGDALAASGEPRGWAEAGRRLLAAADVGGNGAAPAHVHVGTEEGEAFAVRRGELAMVAVTDRFVLTSLVLSDMRTLLRDLAAGDVVDHRAPERGDIPIEHESEEELAEAGPEAATPPAA